jgi:Flp pilus assembly protein TadB
VAEVLAALSLTLALLPPCWWPMGLPLAGLAVLVPAAALLPAAFAAVPPLSEAWRRQATAQAVRGEFRDVLLTLTLSALDGYGVASALAHLAETSSTPLGEALTDLAVGLRTGQDPDAALLAFTARVPWKPAERLADAIRRERFFGVSQGETLARQLEVLHLEDEEERRRQLALLPYLFTLSVGLLFLDGGLVVFLPALRALLGGFSTL